MYKKYFIYTVFYIILLFLIVGGVIFIVDPLQQYRQATFYKPYFSNQRYMNPGMVKTFDFNTLILGTSTSENFIPKNVDQILSVKSLKTPYNGGTSYEYNKILSTALKRRNVKRIIIGLDYFSLSGAVDRVRYVGLPDYLYDDNLFNDYKYLFNINILIKEILFKIIPSNFFYINTERLNKDNPYFWWKNNLASKDNVLKFWNNRSSIKQDFNVGELQFDNLIENFNSNLLEHINRNKNVQFYVFLPPYSILYWIDAENEGHLKQIFEFREYLFKLSLEYNNLNVFDNQIEKKIIFNLDNYQDLIHYSSDINNEILYIIRDNKSVNHYSIKHNNILLRRLIDKGIKIYGN